MNVDGCYHRWVTSFNRRKPGLGEGKRDSTGNKELMRDSQAAKVVLHVALHATRHTNSDEANLRQCLA